MAGLARSVDRPVKDKRSPSDVLAFVAPGARHFLMRTLQPEARIPIVNETQVLPGLRSVAFIARLHRLGLAELSEVRICVAGHAATIHRFEQRPLHCRAPIHQAVTLPAGHLSVFPHERKARLAVIEKGFLPALSAVATLTPASGNTAGELALVNIVMATHATQVVEGEDPKALPPAIDFELMATVTRLGHVGPSERKSRALVLPDSKKRRDKALLVVAAIATAAVFPLPELAQMNIAVAVAALREIQGAGHVGGGVALFAGHLGVLASQRKTGARVVESATPYDLPGGGLMATLAVRSKFAGVCVTMAWSAIPETQAGKTNKGPVLLVWRMPVAYLCMASTTIEADVSAGESKAGLVVIEPGRRLPGLLTVAAETILAQLFSMLVEVARKAILAQPQERPVEIDVLLIGT